MSYATVHSCTLAGVQAIPIIVEVHIAAGLPGMSIVGLPQSAVRESKDRVKAAINNEGIDFPNRKIIVNLAPADLPKQGGRFDLPIALGILLAMGRLPPSAFERLVVVGELGLTGELRAVSGVLPSAAALSDSNEFFLIPKANIKEALRSRNTEILAAGSLGDAIRILIQPYKFHLLRESRAGGRNGADRDHVNGATSADMRDVIGQHQARRALEVAAAGSHNVLMVGPPGTGKSMLACRLPSIQPPMTEGEAMETASVLSISRGGFQDSQWACRPFRAPHHTASGVALVGGGSNPMPGEVSLAHHGVLFLDELPEFSRHVLDVLREPIETGEISVSRAAKQAIFPARFQLIAAMNPCPCGYYGDRETECRCTPDQVARYQSRVSGPFLDRLDIHLTMTRTDKQLWQLETNEESSSTIRARVVAARTRQLERQGIDNAKLSVGVLKQQAFLSTEAEDCLSLAVDKLTLSLRSMHRIQRVARTIADLDGKAAIAVAHMAEALSYRSLRR